MGAAFDQFMAYVEKKGRSAVYLRDLRSRLGRFADAYQASEVHAIASTDLRQWLDTLTGSARSRDNARDLLITFFGYCQRNRFLPKGALPTDDIERFTDGDEGGEIQIFTPAEMRSLLAAARADVLAYLVLGAFAGIRTAELARLEWQDVDLASGYIEIKGRKAKTRQRRLIRIQPNLAAWLALLKRPEGPVMRLKRPEKTMYEICARKAGIAWRRNALRHSFISYRLAATNDENLVASEAGNSPAMVYQQLLAARPPRTGGGMVRHRARSGRECHPDAPGGDMKIDIVHFMPKPLLAIIEPDGRITRALADISPAIGGRSRPRRWKRTPASRPRASAGSLASSISWWIITCRTGNWARETAT